MQDKKLFAIRVIFSSAASPGSLTKQAARLTDPDGRSDRFGSWLRENAETIGDDRRSYSSKTVPAHKRESALNFKNV